MTNDSMEVQCPECGAGVLYDDILEADFNADLSRCPECGEVFPTDDLFE